MKEQIGTRSMSRRRRGSPRARVSSRMWLSRRVVAALVGLLAAGSGVGAQPAPGAQATPVAGVEASVEGGVLSAVDEAAAAELARETGSEVLVDGATTSDSVTYALPDGSFRLEVTNGPTRIRRQGEWVDIDTTLVVAGGALRPRAVPVDFSVSAGGSGPFALLRSGERSYGLSWPGPLPAPVVDGSTATYKGLRLPSGDVVDLTVTATKFGFTHAVVLRERPTSPVEIRLPVVTTGGVGLVERPESLLDLGGPELSIQDGSGEVLAAAAEPWMWDSSYDPDQGEPAHSAAVESSVEFDGTGGQELVLRPDPVFLADPDVRFPVVVDPDTTRWPSTDTWIQNGYTTSKVGSTELKAGFWDRDDCGSGCTARSFLTFNVDAIRGTQVLDADLWLYAYWASSCFADDGLQVRRVTSSWSSSSLTWYSSPQPSTTTDGAVISKTRKGYSSSCPDGYIDWDIDAIATDWANGVANYGLRIAAANEQDRWSWTRFRSANFSTDNVEVEPRLIVRYNHWPVTPKAADLSSNPGGSCSTSSTSPGMSTTTTPKLTAILKDADDRVGGEFEWYLGATRKGGQTIAPVTNGSISSGLAFAATIPSGQFSNSQVVAWRARAKDDTAVSGWSPWCYLRIDTAAPAPPILSSPHYPNDGVEHDGVGKWGYFDAAAGSADVVKYEYTFPGQAPLTVAVSQGGSARRHWTPYQDGTFILQVRSQDAAGNWSTYSSHTFRVKAGSLPVAYWKLDETTGAVAAGVPGGCVATCPDAPLGGAGATWTTSGRVDGALAMDGSSTAYAATSGPAVNTSNSYTVAAWVKLTGNTSYQTVVRQMGTNTGIFSLYYSPAVNKWAFQAATADTVGASYVWAWSDAAPPIGTWVHLVATFDNDKNQLRMYVNGVEQASKGSYGALVSSTGRLEIGTGLRGSVDEVRVYDRLLAPGEISQLVTSAAVLESHWSFNEKSGTTSANNIAGKPIALFRDGADWNFEDPEFSWFFGASDVVFDETGDVDLDPDYVSTDDGDPATQDWVLATDGSYSVGLWAFPYRLPGAGERLPVVAQGGQVNSAFRVEATIPAGQSAARWALVIPQSETVGAAETVVWSNDAVRLFEPVHLMVTYNELDRVATLYVNGDCTRWDPTTGQPIVPCAPTPVPAVFDSVGRVDIGRAYRGGSPSYFNGEIDEVRLYSGVVSQHQIAELQ